MPLERSIDGESISGGGGRGSSSKKEREDNTLLGSLVAGQMHVQDDEEGEGKGGRR